MNDQRLQVLLMQIELQCRFVVWAVEDLNEAIQHNESSTRVFFALQNLLGAAANVAKALWGSKGRKADERSALRQHLAIGEDSPLRNVDMRNNFEHFDERVDAWFERGAKAYVDLNIGDPRDWVRHVGHDDIFRSYDPHRRTLIFWGQEYNVQHIATEASRILSIIPSSIRE